MHVFVGGSRRQKATNAPSVINQLCSAHAISVTGIIPVSTIAGPFHHAMGMVSLVRSVDEVIGVVLEGVMMDEGVGFEGVINSQERAMHHEAVERPLKE